MRDVYSDDYDSVAGVGPDPLIPGSMQKLAGAAVFLGLIAAMGLWSYRLGTRDAAEVPIIKAMEGPARIEPQDPGGLRTAHQGLEVNAVLAGRTEQMPADAPPPRPAPEVLAAEDGPRGELIVAAPLVQPGAEPAPGSDLPMPGQEDMPELLAAIPEGGVVPGATVRDIQSELAALVSEAVPADATEPPAEGAAAALGPRPKGRPANLAAARAKAPEAALVTAAAPTPAAAVPVREVSSPGAGARLVQLGAYDSEEIARQAWTQLVARQGDLLESKSLYIERTTSNARVFYRLRVAGFQTRDQTQAMCEALRARGIDCIPVTLR